MLADNQVPVVALNTDLTETRRLCYVGADYMESGRTAAGLLSMIRPVKKNLLIVTGSRQMKGHNERVSGFLQCLKESEYSLKAIIESLDNDGHAYEITRDAFKKYSEIDSIYIAAAGVSGVCRAAGDAGALDRTVILAHDDIPSSRKLVQDGIIQFTICQQPFQQGRRAIFSLFNYFMDDKKASPSDWFADTVIKMKENLI